MVWVIEFLANLEGTNSISETNKNIEDTLRLLKLCETKIVYFAYVPVWGPVLG